MSIHADWCASLKTIDSDCNCEASLSQAPFKIHDTGTYGGTVIKDRAKIRAPFPEQARVSQNLKRMIFDSPCVGNLSNSQRESLEHIANKIARIVTGDPNEVDAWTDISGYAELIINELTGRKI